MQGSGRESLWSVSAKRLPYYLLIFAVVMMVSLVASIATATGKFWDAVMTTASGIAAVGAATGGMLIAVEGTVVGLTQLIFDKARKQARQEGHREGIREGRQEGIREGIRQERNRLRKAGVDIPRDETPNENREDQP